MSPETFTKSYTFEKDKTCKQEWIFTLSQTADGLVIDELEIVPHTNENGSHRGCNGHPRTIAALIKGQLVVSVDVETLNGAACARQIACGQVLAKCLRDLKGKP